jgi:hypothetical protein
MMRILIRPTYDRLRHSLRSPTLVGVDSQLTGNQLAYDRAVALHTYTHTGHTGKDVPPTIQYNSGGNTIFPDNGM